MAWGDGIVAAGTREIANFHADKFVVVIGMEFVLDGGEDAEEEVAGVGHDGGAARGDAVFGLKKQEAGEEII